MKLSINIHLKLSDLKLKNFETLRNLNLNAFNLVHPRKQCKGNVGPVFLTDFLIPIEALKPVGYALTAAADAACVSRFGLFSFVATDPAVTTLAVVMWPRQHHSIATLTQVFGLRNLM